ncbi:condensation domain-containing protein [Streptomyces sp. NPDC001388]|uniref:condensation domain-containing protein n=1 Tax=unclassified Streptomyces TaxID=2593676 RepID=UPI003682CE9D
MTVRDGIEPDTGSPRTERLQAVLTELWREALGTAAVGLDDHFFDLGGNSITSVLISGRARDLGLAVTTRLLFDNPTIRALSSALLEADPGLSVAGWTGGETIPLSPFQHSFLEQPSEPDVIELRAARRLDPALLRTALTTVCERHEALRLRFTHGPSQWVQSAAGPDGSIAFAHHDIRGSTTHTYAASARHLVRNLAAGLDPASGPVLAAALLDTEESGHLFLAVHPLAADRYAQELLLGEISSVYEQLENGTQPAPPAPATPFSRWVRHLHDWLGSEEAARELRYWLGLPQSVGTPWGTGPADPRPDAQVTASAELSEERTRALLDTLAHQPLIELLDVLLAATAGAIGSWTGVSRTLVDLECDGRRGLAADHDFSTTIGACTASFPFVADLGEAGSTGEQVRAVRAARRAVPHGGAGHGALRTLSLDPAVREQLAAGPEAAIRVRLPAAPPPLFTEVATGRAPGRHALDVTGRLDDGRVRVSVTGRRDLASDKLTDRLAEEIVARMDKAAGELERGADHPYTPHDFPLSGLDSEQLTKLLSGLNTDEDTTQR